MARIVALYAIEDEIRGKPAGLRREVRQARAKPLLDQLNKWMKKVVRQLSPKSETATAIRYSLSRWRALTRYVDDGRLEIDNNSAERALRVVALGRNYTQFPIMRSVATIRCRVGTAIGLRLCLLSASLHNLWSPDAGILDARSHHGKRITSSPAGTRVVGT